MGQDHIPRELLASAVAGDSTAAERLSVHHDRLMAALRRRYGRSRRIVLEDLAQQTYLEAYRSISSFKPGAPDGLFRWLLGIADHRASDLCRREHAQRRGGGKAGNGADAARLSLEAVEQFLAAASRSSPSRCAARTEIEQILTHALAYLPADYRTAIRLRYIRAMPVAQIAAEMDRTERAVHMLCNRGLKRLRDVLGSASAFLSSSA